MALKEKCLNLNVHPSDMTMPDLGLPSRQDKKCYSILNFHF